MSRNNRESTFVGIIVILAIVLLLCTGTIGWITGGFHFSDGHREGTVQKFSTKGFVFKTDEGELAMTGVKSIGENGVSNVFEFTVLEPSIKREIDDLHADQKVRLYYQQYRFGPPWNGDSQYRIWKVEKLK